MGTKPSNNMQSNRPESGGADHDEQREKSGLLERDKAKYAAEQASRKEDDRPNQPLNEKSSSPKPENESDGSE
jgi:hypothetical protein